MLVLPLMHFFLPHPFPHPFCMPVRFFITPSLMHAPPPLVCLLSPLCQTIRRTLGALRAGFGRVFFVPGNHELWCRDPSGPQTSLAKLEAVLDSCHELGVETSTGVVGDALIVPMLSWYHSVRGPWLPVRWVHCVKPCGVCQGACGVLGSSRRLLGLLWGY